MIWGQMFPGDDNETAMNVQADLYIGCILSLMHDLATHRPRPEPPAGRNVESLINRLPHKQKGLDHRTHQYQLDLIAAEFRMSFATELEKRPTEDHRRHELRIAATWTFFVLQEMPRLFEDPEYLQAHLDAVEFENSPIGYAGEKRMREILHRRYWRLARPKREGE